MHEHRILNIRGPKQIYSQTGSKNATHSYMIMLMGSMSGRLMDVVCKKSRNTFEDKRLLLFLIIHSTRYCCISRFIGNNEQWFEDLFASSIEQLKRENIMNSLLLCDSWNSNRNDIFNEVATEFSEIKIKRMFIPPSTTQPLDMFFFQPYKIFVRFVSDSLEISEIKIWQRNNYF